MVARDLIKRPSGKLHCINKWGPLLLAVHLISTATFTPASANLQPDQLRPPPASNRAAIINLNQQQQQQQQLRRNITQVPSPGQLALAAVRQRWRQLDRSLVESLASSADELTKLLASAQISSPCSLALADLVDGLAKQRLWASEMLDASARRLPSGLLEGTLTELGNYDQCVQLSQAQYCTVQVKPALVARPRLHTVCQRLGPASSPVTSNSSLPTRLLAEHSHQFYYAGLRLGVCAPSKCSTGDLQQLLTNYLAKSELIGQLKSCVAGKGARPLDDTQQWIAAVFVLLLSLCLLGTLLDYCNPLKDKTTDIKNRDFINLKRKQVVGRRANVGQKRHWQYQVYQSATDREDYGDPRAKPLGEQRNPLVHGPANLFCAIHGQKPQANNTTCTSASDQDDESWIAQLEQNQANFERDHLTDRLAPADQKKGSNLGPRSVKILSSAIRCFSLKSNLKAIGKLNQTDASDKLTDIKVIHGLRTFTMIWIIFGHTIGLVTPEMMNNLFTLARQACSSRLLQALLNATLAVNTFFMISGLVTVVSIARKSPSIRRLLTESPPIEAKHQPVRLQEDLASCSSSSTSSVLSSSLESNSTSSHRRCIERSPVGRRSAGSQARQQQEAVSRQEFRPFLWLAMRYLRLTPAYAATVGLSVLLTSLGSGPFWSETAGQLGAACRRNWWTNLAYVNNFVDTERLCLIHSWYLSNDWQFFLVTLTLIWCMHRSRRLAFLILVTLGVLGASITFASTVINGFPPTIVTTSPAVAERWHFIHSLYYKPWPHLGSYLVGLVTGYLIVRRQQRASSPASRNSRYCRLLAWSMCGLIAFALLNSIYPWNMGFQVETNIAGLHSASFRTLWAACCGWLVYALADNEQNWLAKLLGWPGFQLPSRLTYCAYLVHPLIIYYDFGMLRERLDSSIYGQMHRFAAILGLSYAAALLLSLLVEAPSIQLQQLIARLVCGSGPQPGADGAVKSPLRSRTTTSSDSWRASSSCDDQERREQSLAGHRRRENSAESFNLLHMKPGSQVSPVLPPSDKQPETIKKRRSSSIAEDSNTEQSKGALDDGDFQQKLAQAIGRGFRIRARMANGLPAGASRRAPLIRAGEASAYQPGTSLGERSVALGNKLGHGSSKSTTSSKQLSTFLPASTGKNAATSQPD